MNEKLKKAIGYAMYDNDMTKMELSEIMDISYPTMLSKLSNPQSMKISEMTKVCEILDIDLKELLTIN
tara:strand:+ start:2124 stop:2327 length:204 start_codon:yes stop_codon:yes gene_type:complete